MRLLAKLLGEAFARPDSNREDFASLVLWATNPLAAFSAHEVVRGECARPDSNRSKTIALASLERCDLQDSNPLLLPHSFSHFVRKLVQCAGPDSNRRTLRDSVLSALPFKCPLWRSRWRAPKITRDARSRCARALAGVWRTLASRGLACIAIVSPRTIKVTRGTAFCDTTVRRPLSRRSPRFQSGPAVCIDNPSPIANR